MSRIGKKPIIITPGVQVEIQGNRVKVKGPKGELERSFPVEIKIQQANNELIVAPQVETKKTSALWGLTRMLLSNMVQGVTEGFQKKLIIAGIGFKFVLEGNDLVLNIGYSHPVKFKAPENITFSLEKNTLTISGFNKELVSQTAANIRKIKEPEPYKGKGIAYEGEVIRKKVGKKAAAAK